MRLEPLVLVVEDDGDIRESVRQLLEGEGYAVEEASNGRAALDRLEREPRPAVVLLDLMMPVMNGQALLLELETRPDLASVPIVVMTASAIEETSSTLNVPLLRKPVDPDALLQIVEQYSPRFWDDEEAPTEEIPIPRGFQAQYVDTATQVCRFCGEKAVARCAACGEALCGTCLASGSVGVCPGCSQRRDRR